MYCSYLGLTASMLAPGRMRCVGIHTERRGGNGVGLEIELEKVWWKHTDGRKGINRMETESVCWIRSF